MLKEISIKTNKRNQLLDITADITRAVSHENGIAVIYTPHTTAAITINENADPSVRDDILKRLNELSPQYNDYRHFEGNSDAHIKCSIIGCSETIIIQNGKPLLGQWQGIYFCEFDGPRTRKVFIKIL